jgi:hypothetical protein
MPTLRNIMANVLWEQQCASCGCAWWRWHCNCSALLWYTWDVTTQTFVTKCPGCCTKVSPFCIIMPCSILPAGLVTSYSATAQRLWTMLPTVLHLYLVLSISLVPVRSTWLTSDLQQMLTCTLSVTWQQFLLCWDTNHSASILELLLISKYSVFSHHYETKLRLYF